MTDICKHCGLPTITDTGVRICNGCGGVLCVDCRGDQCPNRETTTSPELVDELRDRPDVYISEVLESHCNSCDRVADLRLGHCWDCAEAESVIGDGTDMYDKGNDGKVARTAMEKLEFLVAKGWKGPKESKRLAEQVRELTTERNRFKKVAEHYADRNRWDASLGRMNRNIYRSMADNGYAVAQAALKGETE